MIDRTQLTEALALADGDKDSVVVQAARLLLDFPTDEMVELLAGLISTIDTVPAEHHPADQLEIARAGLEAVRRIMIRDNQ